MELDIRLKLKVKGGEKIMKELVKKVLTNKKTRSSKLLSTTLILGLPFLPWGG